MLDARHLEPALTEQEILLRDAFVCEYMKDFSAHQACVRLGFAATYVSEWSKRLWEDGYVQRKIAQATALPATEVAAQKRAKIENRLMHIALRGSDSASVAAMRELNAMNGWSKPDGSEGAEDLVDQFRRLAQALPA